MVIPAFFLVPCFFFAPADVGHVYRNGHPSLLCSLAHASTGLSNCRIVCREQGGAGHLTGSMLGSLCKASAAAALRGKQQPGEGAAASDSWRSDRDAAGVHRGRKRCVSCVGSAGCSPPRPAKASSTGPGADEASQPGPTVPPIRPSQISLESPALATQRLDKALTSPAASHLCVEESTWFEGSARPRNLCSFKPMRDVLASVAAADVCSVGRQASAESLVMVDAHWFVRGGNFSQQEKHKKLLRKMKSVLEGKVGTFELCHHGC